MSFEPFGPLLILFLLRYLRKDLRRFAPNPWWNTIITRSMYCVGILFTLEISFGWHKVTVWVWHLVLIAIVIAAYKLPVFARARTVMIAVLPLIIIALFSDILEVLDNKLYRFLDTYIEFAYAIAITWMIAMLIKSNKQNKALEIERRKTHEEEERNKFMAAQKVELESIVEQRTAEITRQKNELENTLEELRTTQTQLIHSEKMASLGELTAGIAHEIQNPLNFVNNFSEINFELIEEMKNELEAGNVVEAVSIADNIKDNEQKIIHHGKRADAIVKGMLQHSRSSNGQKELTDINALADEYLRLSYHGLRAKDKSFNATMETHFDESLEKILVIPQDVGRAFLNLFTNAFYAVTERKKHAGDDYKPTVSVSTKKFADSIEIRIRDNGTGISDKALDKIFQPFFTTKPTGQGTGLGLSLSFEIITKGHGGEMKIETEEGKYAEFIVELPI